MIPKIIHYCWFGRKPLPQIAQKCIASWQKYMSNYEIKEWNEDNFDVNSIEYTRQAYEAKKYAFVSDYARFWILYHYGGIYFDTDVELIKPIDDIISKGAFMGCETKSDSVNGVSCAPGLGLAASAKMHFYKKMLDNYASRQFIKDDGQYDLTTIVVYTTNLLKTFGLKNIDKCQCIDQINIYPKDYFCPIDYFTGKECFTDNTRSIHYYSASWLNEQERYSFDLRNKLSKLFKPIWASRIAFVLSNIKYNGVCHTLEIIRDILKKHWKTNG